MLHIVFLKFIGKTGLAELGGARQHPQKGCSGAAMSRVLGSNVGVGTKP